MRGIACYRHQFLDVQLNWLPVKDPYNFNNYIGIAKTITKGNTVCWNSSLAINVRTKHMTFEPFQRRLKFKKRKIDDPRYY